MDMSKEQVEDMTTPEWRPRLLDRVVDVRSMECGCFECRGGGPELDHSYTSQIVCPYCGYEDRDSWELNDDSGETECGECEMTFNYRRNVSVTYSTTKKAPSCAGKEGGE